MDCFGAGLWMESRASDALQLVFILNKALDISWTLQIVFMALEMLQLVSYALPPSSSPTHSSFTKALAIAMEVLSSSAVTLEFFFSSVPTLL